MSVTRKLSILIVLLSMISVITIARLALAIERFSQGHFEAKAEKFDEVCSLAKSALRVDRNLLTFDTATRDRMLVNFANDDIGDGYVMLDWCVPYAAMYVAAVRACERNYPCVERMLATTEIAVIR